MLQWSLQATPQSQYPPCFGDNIEHLGSIPILSGLPTFGNTIATPVQLGYMHSVGEHGSGDIVPNIMVPAEVSEHYSTPLFCISAHICHGINQCLFHVATVHGGT